MDLEDLAKLVIELYTLANSLLKMAFSSRQP